ncbi:MAG: Ig-like domain-containing protein [Candidatus Sigynarchaeota archaeon]
MKGSNFFVTNQALNGTVTQLNFSVSLSAYYQHSCKLAMPVGCDFDMRLYNPSNTLVASAMTRSTAGSNESFVYFNNGPIGTFKIQISRYSGDGNFNLSVIEIQKYVIDNLTPYTQAFEANYNSTGSWASTANRNPWSLTDADFISSPTSMRLVGAGIPIFDLPLGSGTLDSPLFDLRGSYSYYFSFGYRFLNGAGYLQIRVNCTGPWDNLVALNALATTWTRVVLNLTNYKGSHVQLRFSLTGVLSGGYFFLDNFELHTIGTASFSNPVMTPLMGTIYETFHFQVTYRETHNIFPSEIYVSIWNGAVPNVKRVDLVDVDPMDWDVSNGKLYKCDLQLFDISNPVLICVSDRIPLYLVSAPNMNVPIESGSFPYMLDFEGPGTYYFINDPVYDPPTIETNAYGHYFNVGTIAGDPTDNSGSARVGLVTPWVHITSGLQAFLECDVTFNEAIQLPINAFRINITSNGVVWNTVAAYESGFAGKISINLTTYNGKDVSLRFFMESSVIGGFRTASCTLDNITVVEKDFIRPTMTTLSISNGQWLFGVVNVEMTVNDVGFGVDRVIVRVDGQDLVTIKTFTGNKAQFSFDTTRLGLGDHEITFVVVDKSGNQNSYTIVVHVDNTPYWLYAAIAAAAIIFGIYGYRRLKKAKPAIQRLMRGEAIPPMDVAKKILEVTSIFRNITAMDLARKMDMKGLTAEKVLAYLRYMIGEGMIKGSLDGDVFRRTMAGKMKVMLADKEAAIIDYMRGRKQTTVADMIKDLHIEGVSKDALEDYIMGLVVSGKLNCFFEGDTIYSEDEAVAKVKEPIPEPAPVPEPASRATKKKAIPEDKESERQEVSMPSTVVQTQEAEPAKAPLTIADKKGDVMRLLSSKDRVTFQEIKKELALRETAEEIEDYLFDLIKNREIKGIIEDDGFSRRE